MSTPQSPIWTHLSAQSAKLPPSNRRERRADSAAHLQHPSGLAQQLVAEHWKLDRDPVPLDLEVQRLCRSKQCYCFYPVHVTDRKAAPRPARKNHKHVVAFCREESFNSRLARFGPDR